MAKLELSLSEIISVLGAKNLSARLPKDADRIGALAQFAYDSRKIQNDDVFVCIPGNRVDGHNFAGEVVKAGARVVIGQTESKLAAHAQTHPDATFLLVEDVLEAVQKLAGYYREKFKVPVAGVAGAVGKTTSKDLTVTILREAGPMLATEGSLNNHWGLPQTVLKWERAHRSAVFELGTSGFGEVKSLSQICKPEIGVITNIGKEHLEMLGDEEGSLRANRELFDWIRDHCENGTLIFNLDNLYLERLHKEYQNGKCRMLTISTSRSSADMRLTSHRALGFEHRFGSAYVFETPWGRIEGVLPLPGLHNLMNALCAATTALATGTVSVDHVISGLMRPKISKLRSDLFQSPSLRTLVYDDSYNANPTSFTALFEAGAEIRAQPQSGVKRVIAVVGDMLELGDNSAGFHAEMGALAVQKNVDVLLACGVFRDEWVKGCGAKAKAFGDQNDLIRELQRLLSSAPESTLVLVKGSRGSKMDEVVKILRA